MEADHLLRGYVLGLLTGVGIVSLAYLKGMLWST